METVAEALSTLGVLVLPIVVALLFEEILFGGLAQLLFARRPEASLTMERSTQGEIS